MNADAALTPTFEKQDDSVELGPNAYSHDVTRGFMIVDGQYISTPYKLVVDQDVIHVNDQVYGKGYFDLSKYREMEPRRGGRFADGGRFGERGRGGFGSGIGGTFAGRGSRGGRRNGKEMGDQVWQDVSSVLVGATVILNRGQAPQVISAGTGGTAAYLSLVQHQNDPAMSVEMPPQLASRIDDETWAQLVAVFRSSPELQTAAGELVTKVQAVDDLSQKQIASNTWVQRFAFPLTVFGYIMVVFAVGHLMQHSSKMFGNEADLPDEVIRRVSIRTLAIVAVLSAVDLIWTLMAHHAGSMRELNPLGSGVIDDPVRLVLFKTCVTSISIGLLYHLHQSTMARQAAWWCCLVLTLLTARWLTFQSMFV